MPAVSKKQQRFMGMVHAIQVGDLSPTEVSPKMRRVARNMKPSAAKEFAETSHAGLPMRKKGSLWRETKELKLSLTRALDAHRRLKAIGEFEKRYGKHVNIPSNTPFSIGDPFERSFQKKILRAVRKNNLIWAGKGMVIPGTAVTGTALAIKKAGAVLPPTEERWNPLRGLRRLRVLPIGHSKKAEFLFNKLLNEINS